MNQEEQTRAEATHRIVRIAEVGGPEVLEVQTESVAEPGEGEVRIRTSIIGVNRGEAAFRAGSYVVPTTPPVGIGYEASGTVTAVGPGVSHLSVGDPVAVVPAFDPNAYSTYAQEPILPVTAVVPLPADLSLEVGACLVQYLTAWGALVSLGDVKPGEHVLINAASSSVGVAAIQICRDIGAVPLAVTRSPEKADTLRAAGAEAVITADGPIAPRVQELTGGKGADLVLDPVLGTAFTDTADCAAMFGRVIIYGVLGGWEASLPVFQIIGKGLTVKGWNLPVLFGTPRFQSAVDYLLPKLRSGAFSPLVDRTFALDEVREAHVYIESNEQVGKILMVP